MAAKKFNDAPKFANIQEAGLAGYENQGGLEPESVRIPANTLARTTEGKNLFNKAIIIPDTYPNQSNGGDTTSLAGFNTSDFIKVDAGHDYAISNAGSIFGCYYDIKSEYIGEGWRGSRKFSFTPPVGAEFIRLSVEDDDLDGFQVEKNTEQTSFEPYKRFIPESLIPFGSFFKVNENAYPDSGMYLIDRLDESGIRTGSQSGSPTFEIAYNGMFGNQTTIKTDVGDRGQLLAPFSAIANTKISFGFFYKVVSGNVLPSDSSYTFESVIPDNISIGATSRVELNNGWVFYKREGLEYSSDVDSFTNGCIIELRNESGSEYCEAVICSPILVNAETIDPSHVNGTFEIISELEKNASGWFESSLSEYGDSVVAINNGDFEKPYSIDENTVWGNYIADHFQFAKHYGRGIGAQKFAWGTNGGSVAFVDPLTGNYDSRSDSYNYDNYAGNVPIPAGTVPIRGSLSSWLRITSMYPASIKDTISVVVLMSHNDINGADNPLAWVDSDTTDPEWAASDEYATYGGDYNIAELRGGIASTIMKLQAWMPNAIIVLSTPMSGRGTTGQLNPELTDPKMEFVASVVREMHELMSVPLIDTYATCGINGLNRTTYITDEIHPYNKAGKQAVARAYIGGLKAILPNYKD